VSPDAGSGVYKTVPPSDGHWCDLVGCERVCECGATCEDHMEDRVPCAKFQEDDDLGWDLAANGE
jgi:hypothetical protein